MSATHRYWVRYWRAYAQEHFTLKDKARLLQALREDPCSANRMALSGWYHKYGDLWEARRLGGFLIGHGTCSSWKKMKYDLGMQPWRHRALEFALVMEHLWEQPGFRAVISYRLDVLGMSVIEAIRPQIRRPKLLRRHFWLVPGKKTKRPTGPSTGHGWGWMQDPTRPRSGWWVISGYGSRAPEPVTGDKIPVMADHAQQQCIALGVHLVPGQRLAPNLTFQYAYPDGQLLLRREWFLRETDARHHAEYVSQTAKPPSAKLCRIRKPHCTFWYGTDPAFCKMPKRG